MIKILIASIIFISLSGCNGVVKDFVDGAKPAEPVTPTPPNSQDDLGGPYMKLSPGHMVSADQGIGVKVNITTTKKTVSGDGVSAELSLSRSR